MFRQVKEMKAMLEGTSGMISQAQLMDAPTWRLAAARQAVKQVRRTQDHGLPAGPQAGHAVARPDFDPIAGVTLEQYAAICAAAYGHDSSTMTEIAEARGISPDAWLSAVTGWNARLRAHAAVARRFNLQYREN